MTSLTFAYFAPTLPEDVVRRSTTAVRETVLSSVDQSATAGDRDPAYRIGGWESEWRRLETTEEPLPEDVVAEMRDAERASVQFWDDDRDWTLSFQFDAGSNGARRPITVHGPHRSAYDTKERSIEAVDTYVERTVDLFTRLAAILDPWFALAQVADGYPTDLSPEGRPPESGIEQLPWLSLFSAEWHDRFGGRDRLLDAPAWNVDVLETGGVLLREYEHPFRIPSEVDREPPLSTYEYLFEGRELPELRAEHERKLNTIVDPFREIEPGERGTDLVVCKGHAPFDSSEIDYHEVTSQIGANDNCYVLWVVRDEDDRLWEVDSGMFVRRLVDEDGRPIGDLPPDVARERELLSASVDTALEPWPTEFFEMDGMEDASFVGKLFGLAGLPEDSDIWRDGNECHGGVDAEQS